MLPAEPLPAASGSASAQSAAGAAPRYWPDEAIVENFGEATIAPIRSLSKGRFKFIGLPIKIKGGTGAPIRAVAWLDG